MAFPEYTISLLTLMLLVGCVLGLCIVVASHLARAMRRESKTHLDERFQNVVLDVLAGSRAAASALDAVPRHEAVAFLEYLYSVRVRLSDEHADILREMASPFRASALRLLRHRRGPLRARGGLLVAEFFPDAGAELLSDPSADVSDAAAFGLARSPNAALRHTLLHRLSSFSRWAPERLAGLLDVLAARDPESVRRFANDPRHHLLLRSSALEALSRCGAHWAESVESVRAAPALALIRPSPLAA